MAADAIQDRMQGTANIAADVIDEREQGTAILAAAAVMQERKQGTLQRLAALNEVRLQESSARKSSMAAAMDPRESVDLFLSSFAQKREAVEAGFALARTKEIEASAMKEHLGKLSLEVTAMEKSVATAAYFLPASVVKASQNTVLKLRDELEIANAELVPKKKFSFRNKLKKTVDTVTSPIERTSESISVEKPGDIVVGSTDVGSTENNPGATPSILSGEGEVAVDNSSLRVGKQLPAFQQPPQASSVISVNNSQLIDGHSNITFVRNAGELGQELTLSNLNNCKVYLKGRMTTLVIHSLKNCHVYAGPVTGSVFIEHVKNSVLVLASHQIRIHSTSSTDFYLRVRSSPIVEYTSENFFAPYAFNYEGILDDLQDANLAEETGLWQKVVDFRWLRAVPSPNWSIKSIESRVSTEDGTNVVGVRCNEIPVENRED